MNPSDEKKMLEKIIQGCRNSIKQINEKDIKEIQEQLKILKDLLSTKEIIDSEKSKDYWEKAKLGGGYFLPIVCQLIFSGSFAPPRIWKCRWGTLWQASGPQLETTRYPFSSFS